MPVCPWHTGVVPLMDPAGDGSGLTVIVSEDEIPSPQSMLCPLMVIEPDRAVESKETTIELLPDPEVMDAPTGRVQMYELAPVMTGIL